MMNKMKRALKQDVNAKERMTHQTLLQDYLELQKEFVSKKKKLQIAKEKKETLLAEVRFLRARHGYLLKMQPNEAEIEQNPIRAQNVIKQSKLHVKDRKNSKMQTLATEKSKVLAKDINSDVGDAVLKPSSPFNLLPVLGNEKGDDGNLPVEQELLKVKKELKNQLIDGKKVGKKKISWQDPVALQV